ncbi:MAG TPA: threonine synthase, partial [Polyangiales bacterium]|nr:threonine synthase [Polyangiales bacterium]
IALAALVKLVQREEIKKHERVVVISTASGLKFTDFKIRYHENRIEGVTSQYPNHPVILPNEYEAVKKNVLSSLD